MAEYYRNICELTLKYRDSKEVVVRKAVITLIPNMATYDSDEFEQHYLHRSMSYLQAALHKPSDRDIGELPGLPSDRELMASLCRHRSHVCSACVQDEAVH
jgi:FKBP12-rapamycin complex-associated protein